MHRLFLPRPGVRIVNLSYKLSSVCPEYRRTGTRFGAHSISKKYPICVRPPRKTCIGAIVRNDVDTEIRSSAFSINSVLLDTERIETRDLRPPPVVECIQPNTDVIFSENAVTFSSTRPDLVLFIPAFQALLEILFVVEHVSFRWF
ncbi:MAG: hypothetical protein C4325_02235 [Blastocatellia bacterium]